MKLDMTYIHVHCEIREGDIMFSLLRPYIVEEVVLSCYPHFCLWLYVNDFRVIKINYMIIVPCIFRDV